MRLWQERIARIEWELERLRTAGLVVEAEQPVPQRRRYKIKVRSDVGGRSQLLRVVFPVLYPYFRFEVFADDVSLPLHQHPFEKNLCLLGRQDVYQPATDTVLDFVVNRVPLAIDAANASAAAAAEMEVQQAEPITAYYPYRGIVLLDSDMFEGRIGRQGKLTLGTDSQDGPHPRVAVIEVFNGAGRRIGKASESLARLFPHRFNGHWISREEHLRLDNAERFFRQVARPAEPALSAGHEDVYLVLAPEESAWRQRTGTGIVGIARHAETAPPVQRANRRQRRAAKSRGDTRMDPTYRFLRADRAGPADLQVRVPELKGLRDSVVTLIGLGSLGAPAALAFAQSGVRELRVVDHDTVDAGTTVRFPLGIDAAGQPKVHAIRDFIARHYPYTEVVPFPARLGGIDDDDQAQLLIDLMDGAELLFDATGDDGTEYFLSSLSRAQNLRYLMVSGTLGGWGGIVFRWDPNRSTGCWWCFNHCREDGSIPEPPAQSTSRQIQPQGCTDPTFTGAGFDMHTISLAGVRGAVEMLSDYPRAEWDALIVSLRDASGSAAPPRFDAHSVPQHPACPFCQSPSTSSG